MHSFEDESLEAVVVALPTLYILDLPGLFLGPPSVAHLVKSIQETVDLRLTSVLLRNNRLGDTGVELLVPSLLSPKGFWKGIQHLDLSWNFIGPGGARHLASAIAGSELQRLDLECNDLCDEGAAHIGQALQSCRSLKRLRLGGNRIGPQGGFSLATALKERPADSPCLEELELCRNFLGPKGTKALIEALQSTTNCQPRLRRLGLAVNRVRDEGAEALAAALQAGATPSYSSTHLLLEEIDLGSNLIGDRGAESLAKAFSRGRCSLRWLGLGRNNITPSGAEVLAEALERGSCSLLQCVDLAANDALGSAIMARVAFGLRRNLWSIVLYDPLKAALELCRSGAHCLDLSGIPLGTHGATALGAAIQTRKCRLLSLSLSRTNLGDDGAEALLQAWSTSEGRCRLEELDLSWNGIGMPGARALGKMLVSPSGVFLLRLELECNDLKDAGVEALVDVILGSRHSEQQILGGGPDEGGGGSSQASRSAAVEGGAAPCCALRSLRLAANGLGAASARSLGKMLTSTCCLQLSELELGRNRLGSNGAAMLAESLECSQVQLKRLGLSFNRLQTKGATVLASALQRKVHLNRPASAADVAAGEGGAGSSPGMVFDLRGNFISDEATEALCKLVSSRQVIELDLEHNKIGPQGAEVFARALASLVPLVGSEGQPTPQAQVRLDTDLLDSASQR